MERDPEYAARKDAPTHEDACGRLLRRAEVAAAYEPTPEPPIDELEHAIEHAHAEGGDGDQEAKRERRRHRRRAKAQGRR